MTERTTAARADPDGNLLAAFPTGAAPGGPAYLPVDQWGNLGAERLSPDGCGRALSPCAQYAGMTGRRITGHSGRRGPATTGRRSASGRGSCAPRAAGNSPVFREYVDDAKAFEDAATERPVRRQRSQSSDGLQELLVTSGSFGSAGPTGKPAWRNGTTAQKAGHRIFPWSRGGRPCL